MPNWKCQWVFAQDRAGWTEHWYINKSSPDLALQECLAITANRMQLVGKGVVLDQIRITDPTRPRVGIRKVLNMSNGTNALPVDVWSNCIMCHAYSGPWASRTFWLRSPPDDFIAWSPGFGEVIAQGGAYGAVSKFGNELIDRKFMFQAIDKSGVGGTGAPITGFSVTLDGYLKLQVAGIGVAPGGRVGVKGVKGGPAAEMSLLNRSWLVRRPELDGIVLDALGILFPTVANYAGGRVYPKVKTWGFITGFAIVRPGVRRVGRALTTWKGRVKRR